MRTDVSRKRWLMAITFGLSLLVLAFSTFFGTVLWFGACGDAPGRPICPFLDHGGGSPLLIITPSAAILIGGFFAVRRLTAVPLLGGLLLAVGIYAAFYAAYLSA